MPKRVKNFINNKYIWFFIDILFVIVILFLFFIAPFFFPNFYNSFPFLRNYSIFTKLINNLLIAGTISLLKKTPQILDKILDSSLTKDLIEFIGNHPVFRILLISLLVISSSFIFYNLYNFLIKKDSIGSSDSSLAQSSSSSTEDSLILPSVPGSSTEEISSRLEQLKKFNKENLLNRESCSRRDFSKKEKLQILKDIASSSLEDDETQVSDSSPSSRSFFFTTLRIFIEKLFM